MPKARLEITRRVFSEFYNAVAIFNKGIKIEDKSVIYKSKFSYGISKNMRDLKSDAIIIEDKKKDIVKELSEKVDKLKLEYCELDIDKKPKHDSNGIPIFKEGKKVEFEIKVKELEESEISKEILKKYNQYLDEKEEYEIYQVTTEHFPEISQDIIDRLYLMRMEE